MTRSRPLLAVMAVRGGRRTAWWRLATCVGLIAVRVQALVTPAVLAPRHATRRRCAAMIASTKRTAAACEGKEEGELRLLTVEEVTQLARRTQEFERYRAYQAELQEELGKRTEP